MRRQKNRECLTVISRASFHCQKGTGGPSLGTNSAVASKRVRSTWTTPKLWIASITIYRKVWTWFTWWGDWGLTACVFQLCLTRKFSSLLVWELRISTQILPCMDWNFGREWRPFLRKTSSWLVSPRGIWPFEAERTGLCSKTPYQKLHKFYRWSNSWERRSVNLSSKSNCKTYLRFQVGTRG
jgi:hypothetical protein